ncbi:lipopolysaccharide biosynthesis protein [Caulobacter sp. S45]|uniref:lipopolysaccharide biosynthesis protein n=1 Tax=Caulobacter sp. S45 TaxID=1641861 RepID=UPI00131D2C83|nr:lipopolysaccharide biosynthesis protein [Caulobacter sp. S45]
MFWKGVVGYLPVNIVQAVAGFGSIVVFTRMLSPADYGAYALAYSVTSLVYTCLFVWIEAAMARFYAAETVVGRSNLYATLYRAFAAMAVALPALAVAILVLLPVGSGLKLAIGAGLVSIIVRSLLKLAQERRRAAGQVRGYALFDMAQTGGGFALGAVFALIGWGGAAPLAGAGAASAMCLLFALPSEIGPARRGRFEPERLKGYAAYGAPIALSLIMGLALATTDRFVLAAFTNEATVGAYHAGYSLSNRTLDVMFLWLGMAGGPACIAALERGGRAALEHTAREQASFMVLISLPAAAGLALVARPLAELMVGPALRDNAARVTPWIALSGLFYGLTTHYLNTAFTLARRTGRQFLAIALPALANLALTLLLIPRFGLDGAMWATTASYALGAVASILLQRNGLYLPIPWNTLGRSALATAAMAAAVLRMPSTGGVGELALKAGVGAMTYALVAFALDAGQARTHSGRLLQTLRTRAAA